MSEIQVASRYAKSLIDLAEEQGSLEAVKKDIESFLQVVKANSELRAVLGNPIVGIDKKNAILEAIFGSNVHPIVLGFFKIVTNKGRSAILYATAKEFINEYNRRKGLVKAQVISAAPLSEQNKKDIAAVLLESVKGDVLLETKVDPDLIGGFVLKVGDRQFDASISNSLRKLKKEFAQKVIA
jgi:F-type H+-transporting ATPase subunit delta